MSNKVRYSHKLLDFLADNNPDIPVNDLIQLCVTVDCILQCQEMADRHVETISQFRDDGKMVENFWKNQAK